MFVDTDVSADKCFLNDGGEGGGGGSGGAGGGRVGGGNSRLCLTPL